MKTIFFFRGLNTFGNDNLQIGPFSLGPYWKHLSPDLSPYKVVPILNMKFGKHDDVSARAKNFLINSQEWKNTNEAHFLAHSTGGLIARQTLHLLGPEAKKVKSLLTLATPHKGTVSAEKAAELSSNNKLTHMAFKFLNYDTNKRVHAYNELSRDSVSNFNKNYLDISGIKYASLAFNPEHKNIHLLLRVIKKQVNTDPNFKSDGIIEFDSQHWGSLLESYPLDHLSQLGFHHFLSKKKKSIAKDNYQSMISNMKKFWHNL